MGRACMCVCALIIDKSGLEKYVCVACVCVFVVRWKKLEVFCVCVLTNFFVSLFLPFSLGCAGCKQVDKLSALPVLIGLTLHGNEVEKTPGKRGGATFQILKGIKGGKRRKEKKNERGKV